MLINYFKIAWRNLMKYKAISAINLFGLTIGLTCCLLILAYILNELSYDKFQPYADRTYRISRSFHNEQGVQSLHLGAISPPFHQYLKNAFPEVQVMTRLLANGNTAFVYGEKKFYEKNVFFADENLPDVFKMNMIEGNAKKALEAPFQVLITDELAKKYFGNDDPIDKLVKLDNNIPVKVAGVFKPFPANTHIHPEVLISFNTLKDSAIYGEKNLETNWGNNSFVTYIVLPQHYDYKKLEAKFPAFIDQYYHFPQESPGFKGSRFTHLYLTPITDIHLRSHLDYEVEENGDIKRVYVFSIIALFILLIACINYMNLSTARSILRAKEIGIRKTIGAERKEIIAQFLTESVLMTWLSILLAFALTALLLPWLNEVSGQELTMNILLKGQVLLPLFAAPFVIGILSGLYPAVFMSSFQPVKVLKGLFKVSGNLSVRKALVVAQFVVSIVLIISTVVVFKQLRYMQNTALGYDRNQVVLLPYATALGNQFQAFKTVLLATGQVQSVTRSSRIPTGRLLDDMDAKIANGDSMAPTKADIKFVVVDEDYLPTFGIKTVAGRNFSKDYATDSSGFIINEAAASALGLKNPKDAVDKGFQYGDIKGRIIGVVHDFHFESLHQHIIPMVFFIQAQPNNFGDIAIKISGKNVPAALAQIEKAWRQFLPQTPFQYNFLDERYNQLYESELRQKAIFTAFAGIAIFIACLGLFGLSAFTISQRIKEIGIRKILGADISSIVGLLSKDFLKLVAVAAVIAFPIAWFAMYKWLEDFAYRVGISWWVFVAAGFVAAVIAFVTVSFQAIKAATANPVKNLRTE